MGVVEEEADECCFWLELCLELKVGDEKEAKEILSEANELTSIFTAANRTMKVK